MLLKKCVSLGASPSVGLRAQMKALLFVHRLTC